MIFAEIRTELEEMTDSGCTAADLARLNYAWFTLRADTPQIYHVEIDNRLKTLTSVADLSEPFMMTKDIGFELTELHSHWHWESCGPVFEDAYCSEDGFDTPAEAISDAIAFLTSIYELEIGNDCNNPLASNPIDIQLDSSPYQSGVHFALYVGDENQLYWQGLCQEPNESDKWWNGDDDFAHLASDRGYHNARLAAADCLFSLHTERGYSVEEAVTLVYELGLPVHTVIEENRAAVTEYIEQLKAAEFAKHWGRLWRSDQQAIDSSIQVLPVAAREQARYEMAFRTPPMPEQYWPDEV